LVVSITPCSAALIYESNASGDDGVEERALGSIDVELNEIQSCTNSLNSTLDYVKCRAGDYGWRFWKWPVITSDILGSLKNMLATVETMKGPAEKIRAGTDLLKQLDENNLQIGTLGAADVHDGVYSSYMVDELSKRLKVNVTAKTVPANEVKNGDVVEYMGQGKYPHYLNVVSLEADNKEKKSRSDMMDYTAFLEGNGNKIVSWRLPATVTDLTVENNHSVDNKTLVQTAADIQQDEINKLKERGNKKKWHADNLLIALKVIGGFAASLTVIGGVLVVVGTGLFFTGIGTAAAPFVMIAGGVIALFGVGFYPYVLALGIAYATVNNQANSLLEEAKTKQADLDKWNENKPLKQDNMTLSTFTRKSIIKHPFMEDWKELHPILVKGPEHGKVLFGPGLQFLYDSDDGYVGIDTFTFYYVKEGQTDCETIGHIHVNIQINSIPVLKIPGEGIKG
jgi:hypothetical protein